MKLPELRIGDLVAPIPIIQGGMAVKISTAPLAAAVANEGGIGVIAGTGFDPEDLRLEIRKAKEMTKGIVGVNIMFAAREFATLVRTAIEEKIDLIIYGAGFSRDIFQWGEESGTPIVTIVSSARLAKTAQKLGAAAVIVEGKEAGGHLGTERSMREILPEVKAAVSIPVIAAGGIVDGYDIVEALRLGADGVQMGTRFAASEESNASAEFKQLYVKAEPGDVVLVNSPVGLPGRGLRNAFYDAVEAGKVKITECKQCLKHCSKSFCIFGALEQACSAGDFDKALVFSGEFVHKIKEVLPVKQIFKNLLDEVEKA